MPLEDACPARRQAGEEEEGPDSSTQEVPDGGTVVVKNTFLEVLDDGRTRHMVRRRSLSEPPRLPLHRQSEDSNAETHHRQKSLAEDEASPRATSEIDGDQERWQSEQPRGREVLHGGSSDGLESSSRGSTSSSSSRHRGTGDAAGVVDPSVTLPPEQEWRTTVMLGNLPEDLGRSHLADLLNQEEFGGHYDFIYVPMHFTLESNFGYAFVNFTTSQAAVRFMAHFAGFARWPTSTRGGATVGWGSTLQGLEANVSRYRNSGFMRSAMPDWLKPAVYHNGERVAFPPPTQRLRRVRPRRG